jgi:hypothetical protein
MPLEKERRTSRMRRRMRRRRRSRRNEEEVEEEDEVDEERATNTYVYMLHVGVAVWEFRPQWSCAVVHCLPIHCSLPIHCKSSLLAHFSRSSGSD